MSASELSSSRTAPGTIGKTRRLNRVPDFLGEHQFAPGQVSGGTEDNYSGGWQFEFIFHWLFFHMLFSCAWRPQNLCLELEFVKSAHPVKHTCDAYQVRKIQTGQG